ncbi:MAG: pentapeptide repeat-containing protein [Sphingobacteriia bacterium]|nr:pentapeptide repeat-containing protein [Sphingobacteriia bacterium]
MNSEATLEFCRARSRPIFDADDGTFLGTASVIATNCLLTCEHCINDRERIKDNEKVFSVAFRIPCTDTVLLESSFPQDMTYFVASSDEARIGEEVFIYGYRKRDGEFNDVVILTEIGSLGDRKLSDNCKTHQVYGFGKRYLLEFGMSGGVVLRRSTFEMIGYIIGYDHPLNEDRKDDVFVSISSVIAKSPLLKKRLTYSHQQRASRINLARRLLSLSGFAVNVVQLGTEPGLDECLVCARGEGVLQNIILIITATSEQNHNTNSLKELYSHTYEYTKHLDTHFDHIFVLVDEGMPFDASLHFIVTIEDLIKSTPINSTFNNGDTGLIAGQFLPRFVIDTVEELPVLAAEFIKKAVENGIKLIVVTGSVGSGKSTVITNFLSTSKDRMVTGDNQAPVTFEIDLLNDIDGRIPKGKKDASGPVVVSLIGFDLLWTMGDTTKTLRKIRLIILELNKNFKDWTILLSISLIHERTKLILNPVLTFMDNVGPYKIIELLPLSPENVKNALLFELGASEGNAWWNTIVSSQEIFQIAQWPTGLSVLLDRVVQASWSHHKANQIEVIAALVNGFLGRLSGNTQGLPPSATINFLIALAEEINATQKMRVSIEYARKIYANIAPQTHNIHAIAISDLIVPGLIMQSGSPDTLEFESPIYLHYLLSLAVIKSLKVGNLGIANPLFHRRMPIALLGDVIQLGIEEKQIWNLIKSTIGGKNDEVGFIGGNCISLLRLLKIDFKGCQFANCYLRGGIFTGCDLSNADFTGATLIDVGLANSTLNNTKFSGTDLNRADLKSGCTIYQLKSNCSNVYAATSSRHLVRIKAKRDKVHISNIDGFSDAVFAVALSVSNDLVVAGGQDGTIRGWCLTNNEPRFILRGHFSDIRSLAFVDNRIISGSVDGQVNVWSPWSSSLLNSFSLCGGEIWSLEMINENMVAVICDRNHLHIMSLIDGKVVKKYNLPNRYTRRLYIDHKSNRLFVGCKESIWMLDIKDHTSLLIKLPHPFVRTIFRTQSNEYLIGGAYSKILCANEDFTEFNNVSNSGKDYISDFTEYTNGTVLCSGAGGRLLLLKRTSLGWAQIKDFGLLDGNFQLNAVGADFQEAKNIPADRKKMLSERGALI